MGGVNAGRGARDEVEAEGVVSWPVVWVGPHAYQPNAAALDAEIPLPVGTTPEDLAQGGRDARDGGRGRGVGRNGVLD